MKLFINDLPISSIEGKVVLLRAELNVPLENCGGVPVILSDARIQATLPTINYLISKKAKTICICSHLGRPDGEIVAALSLSPIAARLSALLGREVQLVESCIGEEVERALLSAPEGAVLLLENTRFHPEEEANDPRFSEALAKPFDLFVNDAFGAAHRAHSSTEGVTHFIPICVGGFLMRDEVVNLTAVMTEPKRPLAALIGGAKISTKIKVLQNLLSKVDKLIIGGGMVFTFYKALGTEIGKSLVEDKFVPTAATIISEASARGVRLILATDTVIAEKLHDSNIIETVSINDIPADCMGLDIGRESVALFCKELEECKTIIWNGPLGAVEIDPFSEGTNQMIDFLANLTTQGVVTVVCGGDTAAVVEKRGLGNFTHISTGGGATLEFLEGRSLPGIDSLSDVASIIKS